MWIVDTIDSNGLIYHVSASLELFNSGITGSVDQRGFLSFIRLQQLCVATGQAWGRDERRYCEHRIRTQLFSALLYTSGHRYSRTKSDRNGRLEY